MTVALQENWAGWINYDTLHLLSNHEYLHHTQLKVLIIILIGHHTVFFWYVFIFLKCRLQRMNIVIKIKIRFLLSLDIEIFSVIKKLLNTYVFRTAL